MNELQVFKNPDFGELGIMTIDGKEYFPATKCAKILGYSDPYSAITRHCRDWAKHRVIDKLGREQQTKYIPEGDLWRLIVRSNLPAAEKFERWVFDEVLPSIRKTGGYKAKPSILKNEFKENLKKTEVTIRYINAKTRLATLHLELSKCDRLTEAERNEHAKQASFTMLEPPKVNEEQAKASMKLIGQIMEGYNSKQ